jgi:hypothetical protein
MLRSRSVKTLGLLLLSVAAAPLRAQEGCSGVEVRILLAGDGGELHKDGSRPAVETAELRRRLREDFCPGKTQLLWLGDNVYDNGLPPEGDSPCRASSDKDREERGRGEAVLRAQASVSPELGAVVFVPGNHDWRGGRRAGAECGHARRLAQEAFLAGIGARMLPAGGCPGPAVLDSPGMRLIVYDSEWLLRPKDKPLAECAAGLDVARDAPESEFRRAFFRELESAIRGRGTRPVLLASHHPLRSHGPHGGHYPPQRWIFPLTDLGWAGYLLPLPGLYGLRRTGVIGQDLSGGAYRQMIAQVNEVVGRTGKGSVLAHLAGHEHSLQVLAPDQTGAFQVISGSSAKTTAVARKEDSLFAASAYGYVRLDLVPGRTLLEVFLADAQAPAFCLWLGESAEACGPARGTAEGR